MNILSGENKVVCGEDGRHVPGLEHWDTLTALSFLLLGRRTVSHP